jgi:hypothetical protein
MRNLLALLLLSVVALQAQEPSIDEALTISDDPELMSSFTVDLNVVTIPVIVRGPKGEYIH